MKGLLFSTITKTLLAILGTIIFLSIGLKIIAAFGGKEFCSVYNAISGLPLPSFLKPENPNCKLEEKGELKTIRKEVSLLDKGLLFSFIYDCWERGKKGRGGVDFLCYEIYAKKIKGNITEREIANILKGNKLCQEFPDIFLELEKKYFPCNSTDKKILNKNALLWKKDIKGKEQIIFIKYNAFHHRIEVK